jgi:glycosyltransferase involved in cell wall biosynthesis
MEKFKGIMLSNIKGFSGIHQPLYQELNKIFDISLVLDPFTIPIHRKIFFLIKTFYFTKSEWLNRYHNTLHSSKISCSAFDERTKFCDRELSQYGDTYDFIFQLSSMFMLSNPPSDKPYFIYIDRTPKMVETFYPELFRHLSNKEKTELHKINELVFKKANLIFTFNETATNSLLKDYGIPSEKVFCVSSGVNAVNLQDNQEAKSKLVITVCSDYFRHGGQLCVEAFQLASKELPDVNFMFIGENLSAEKTNIDSVGYLPYNELLQIYSKASVSLMLSPLGGFQTITDSMAHKCVCLALKNNPYTQSVIQYGKNGFIVNSNAKEISKLIISLLNDNNHITKKIGDEAYKYILANCTWKSVVERISKHIINYLER